MATQPIEYEPSPSKTGVQVVPALVVFHTPPEAAATYQVLGRVGSTAMSTMRPPTVAGPMLRSSRPAKVEAESPPFFSSGFSSFPFPSFPFSSLLFLSLLFLSALSAACSALSVFSACTALSALSFSAC